MLSLTQGEETVLMFQRILDSAVLGAFSMLYSCAVFLLKFRPKPSSAPAGRGRT